MSYVKSNGLEMAIGNSKLGNDTIIINLGSAKNCPSRKLGLCKLGNKCYARKAEIQYKPNCEKYRDRQAEYWLNNTAETIGNEIIKVITKKNRFKPVIQFMRFNESGDFYSQDDVDKMEIVARMIRKITGVIVYGYTARKDLKFKHVTSFLVKGSSNTAGNNGSTIARDKKVVEAGQINRYEYVENSLVYMVCPGSCKQCSICKCDKGHNVVFAIH